MMGLYRQTSPKEKHKGGVWGVFVRPEWRGQGIAAQLLDALLARGAAVGRFGAVTVVGGDGVRKRAVRLYQSRGFQVYGLEREALRNGDRYVDEYHMVLFLKKVSDGN